MATSPRQLFGTLGAQRLWQLNLQSCKQKKKKKKNTAKLFLIFGATITIFSCYPTYKCQALLFH